MFFDQLDYPLKPAMELIRKIILGIDDSITEHIKWNAPSYCHSGDVRVTFNLHKAGHILLIAIAIVVLAYVILPSGSDLGRWIIAGGILAFIAACVFSLRRQSKPPEKYWRDRPLDVRRSSGTGTRTRSWWDRWRNR